jgi:hypothetical protein
MRKFVGLIYICNSTIVARMDESMEIMSPYTNCNESCRPTTYTFILKISVVISASERQDLTMQMHVIIFVSFEAISFYTPKNALCKLHTQ